MDGFSVGDREGKGNSQWERDTVGQRDRSHIRNWPRHAMNSKHFHTVLNKVLWVF
jgi:hypothetical protein